MRTAPHLGQGEKMVGVAEMAKQTATKARDAAESREYSTFRCFYEQGELLNKLAKVGDCKNVAVAIEKYLDGPIRELLRKLYSDKAKEF